MGSRKAVVVEEPLSLDDVSDAFPPDDEVAPAVSLGRICLECGGEGHTGYGCAHLEIARLDGASRSAVELVLRLRRAVAEHRTAARALRGLVLSEVARGRAEIEPHPGEPVPDRAPAPLVPCLRCAAHDAEPAAASSAPRGARQKARRSEAQQAFAFASRRSTE
jgi:hypothetical protein